jgi:hypothetical protein
MQTMTIMQYNYFIDKVNQLTDKIVTLQKSKK